jgi:hypothetical protein
MHRCVQINLVRWDNGTKTAAWRLKAMNNVFGMIVVALQGHCVVRIKTDVH